MRAKTSAALACTVLALTACQSVKKITSDTSLDTVVDTTTEDVVTDTGVDVPTDTVADTGVDVAWDTAPDAVDVVDATDAPDTSDPPSDPPTEVGAPCEHDEECDNGLFCDGTEYCHPTGVCRRSPAPDCDDGAECTLDFCSEESESCQHVVDEDLCDDSDPCTEDGCNTTTGVCTHTPVDCDDGTTCTADLCDPLTGACMHEFSDAECDDSNACTVDTCDAATDTCENVLMDDDGDGHPPTSCGGDDCDDTDPMVHPGAADVCGDGVDMDCDGLDGLEGSCGCPVHLGMPDTYMGDTDPMTSVYQGGCATSSPSPEVVHELVITEAAQVSFTVSDTSIYPVLYVRDGACDGVELGCATYSDPTLDLGLDPGTYYVFVEGFSDSYHGPYTLDVRRLFEPTPVTGNDLCSGAWPITAEGTYTGSNSAMTDTTTGSRGSDGALDVWFTFTLTGAAHLVMDTSGSDYDTVVYVRESTCEGTEVGLDDDSGPGLTSHLELDLGAGTYYLILDGYSSSHVGDYVLTVTGL